MDSAAPELAPYVKTAAFGDPLRKLVQRFASKGAPGGAPLAAARNAAEAAHATHLGTTMPSVDVLRQKYQHVTPDSFRAEYRKSLGDTGIDQARRGHTPQTKGVDSFISRGPDGAERVSDAGLAYLHANSLRQETAQVLPRQAQATHQALALQGGLQGFENHVSGKNIHGRPAPRDVDMNEAGLAKLQAAQNRIRASQDAAAAPVRRAPRKPSPAETAPTEFAPSTPPRAPAGGAGGAGGGFLSAARKPAPSATMGGGATLPAPAAIPAPIPGMSPLQAARDAASAAYAKKSPAADFAAKREKMLARAKANGAVAPAPAAPAGPKTHLVHMPGGAQMPVPMDAVAAERMRSMGGTVVPIPEHLLNAKTHELPVPEFMKVQPSPQSLRPVPRPAPAAADAPTRQIRAG